MNNVSLIGRLTKDPEIRYTTGQNQIAIAKFSLAVDDGYGDNKRTSFIPITVFGKSAENCERFLAKGLKAAVSGKIQTGSYEKDGRTIYTTDVIAQNVEFIEFKNQSERGESQLPAVDDDVPSGFVALDDDDIPF